MSDFWSVPSIHLVFEQQRLWLSWAFSDRLCDQYHNLMNWLIYSTFSDVLIFFFFFFGGGGGGVLSVCEIRKLYFRLCTLFCLMLVLTSNSRSLAVISADSNVPMSCSVVWILLSINVRAFHSYMSHAMRKPYANNKGSDQTGHPRLCCSLHGQYKTSTCYSRNFKTLASLISWAGRFEPYCTSLCIMHARA